MILSQFEAVYFCLEGPQRVVNYREARGLNLEMTVIPFHSLPQLEDEALKHIGAHCPELVTLNLQTCSVSPPNMAVISV